MAAVRTAPYIGLIMTDKTIHHGRFVWRELMTPDVAKSKAFYGELFNWKIDDVDMGDFKYPMIKSGDRHQAGMMPIQDPGTPPHWRAFLSVNDVDEAAKTAQAKGGKLLHGPVTMGPGRVAMMLDPSGAPISLWHSTDGDAELPEQPAAGDFCWEDLMTTDASKVEDFYSSIAGYNVESFPGNDKIKVLKLGEAMAGGINTMVPPGTPSHWVSYVVVDSLADARGRVERLGGEVKLAEMPVGELGVIALVTDNVGAGLGLFQSAG